MKKKKNTSGRRQFIKNISLGGAALIAAPALGRAVFSRELSAGEAKFSLPELPYAYDALEPAIDKMTMEIHHGRHHQAYVSNLNKAIEGISFDKFSLEYICSTVSKYPVAVRNNAGGHYNHSLFWSLMKPHGGGEPSGKLAEAIRSTFGHIENFREKFNAAALSRFGSGWAWLVVTKEGKLEITSTANQDNPLMDMADVKGTPVLCLDVWEHAYYLHYQNKRADYVKAWWSVVNWEQSGRIFGSLSK